MKNLNPLELFQQEAPDVQHAYAGLINSLISDDSLDAKTKQLIYIGMKIVSDDEMAVKYHIPMAKAAGASKEDVVSTIVMS